MSWIAPSSLSLIYIGMQGVESLRLATFAFGWLSWPLSMNATVPSSASRLMALLLCGGRLCASESSTPCSSSCGM